ncbi:hypothetical protein WAI453_009863 [Rhynchosporium graminicola]
MEDGNQIAKSHAEVEKVESVTHQEVPEKTRHDGNHHQMRSEIDDLSGWQSVKKQKLITIVAMAAAFSASLDGYLPSICNGGVWTQSRNVHSLGFPDCKHLRGNVCNILGALAHSEVTFRLWCGHASSHFACLPV